MRIGVQTWGSQGDIQPLIALAEGLQHSGHDVTLVITGIDNNRYADTPSRNGTTLRSISTPVIHDSEVLQEIERDIFQQTDPLKQTQLILERLFLPAESAMYTAAQQLCRENDLVIGHFFHYPLHVAAERIGCPYVSIALVPSIIPSPHQPPSGLPDLGTLGNRILWSLVKSMFNRRLKTYPDRLRVRHGLDPARDMLSDVWAAKPLTLVAVSPQLCGNTTGWPSHYKVCGFLNQGEDVDDGDIADELLEFLQQGPPPIYLTFGSAMPGGDPEATLAILIEAVQKAAVRAIIQLADWHKYVPTPNPNPTTLIVGTTPHAKVFPLCQAVLHHGGAGTSQTALLAGRPSIVVAHTSEQQFWGHTLSRLGVAPQPLVRHRLSADILTATIIEVVESTCFTLAAEHLAIQMRKEDGVATAVRYIDEYFSP